MIASARSVYDENALVTASKNSIGVIFFVCKKYPKFGVVERVITKDMYPFECMYIVPITVKSSNRHHQQNEKQKQENNYINNTNNSVEYTN